MTVLIRANVSLMTEGKMDYQLNILSVPCGSARMEELEKLVGLGYGKTKNDVAEYLLSRSLDDLMRAKVIGRVGDDNRRR